MCAAFAAAVVQAHSPVVVVPPGPPEIIVEAAPQPEPSAASAAAVPGLPEVLRPSDAELLRYAAIIRGASRAHGVEGDLVQAVIWAESSYNPDALSPAGGPGVTQLLPQTAARQRVRHGFAPGGRIPPPVTDPGGVP